MVIDASHASDSSFDQMIALSKTPIILSHSGTRALYDSPRNIDDGRIRKLAASGGAICFTTIYLSALHIGPERAALFDQLDHIGGLSIADQADLTRRWRALDRDEPLWSATFDDYINGLLHVIRVAGPAHVCFGADLGRRRRDRRNAGRLRTPCDNRPAARGGLWRHRSRQNAWR